MKLKFSSRFLQKIANVKIRLMKRSELDKVLDIAYQVFSTKISQSEEEFKNEVKEELGNRFSCCYIAEVDVKIVGGYLLVKGKNFKELQELQTEMNEKGIDITNKTGVQGVALFVLPQFAGAGVGKQLREIPIERLGADYVWGEHFKELNNLQNWLNAGRVLLGEREDYFVTLRMIPHPSMSENEPLLPNETRADHIRRMKKEQEQPESEKEQGSVA